MGLLKQDWWFMRERMISEGLSGISRFAPVYWERPWGGRAFECCFGRRLPGPGLFGESWEVVDRPEACSVLRGGSFDGWNLRRLWRERAGEAFGVEPAPGTDFPLILKFLDARLTLSVQVHPREKGSGIGQGDPKTEWWYVVEAQLDACVYAGFQRGVDAGDLRKALKEGTVERLLHRIPVRKGDSLFVPSGRCHAIGAGCLIAEVQQNSDTTYRVFDWNRAGADGSRRALHLEEAFGCINFSDYEPALECSLSEKPFECGHFAVSLLEVREGVQLSGRTGAVFLVVEGEAVAVPNRERFVAGDTFLLPASVEEGLEIVPEERGVRLLKVDLRGVRQKK